MRLCLTLSAILSCCLMCQSSVDAGPIKTDYATAKYEVKSYEGWKQTAQGGNHQIGYGGKYGGVRPNPDTPKDLPIPNANSPIVKMLKQRYPGWTFKFAAKGLADNSFIVKTYTAVHNDLPTSIGGELHVLYDQTLETTIPS